MNLADRPLEKSSKFRPGMPALVIGDVPKSNGSTLTLYWNKPKRKSASQFAVEHGVHAVGEALLARLGDAPQADEFLAAGLAEGRGAVEDELGEL